MEEASVDAIVTDPPYGLGSAPTPEQLIAYIQGEDVRLNNKDFMGKDWAIPTVEVWRECYRVLKPGGYLLSFAGSRTQDLIGLGIRVAGFECRDTIMWVYGQGFPKTSNVAKQIDKALGVTPTDVGENPNHRANSGVTYEGVYAGGNTGGAKLTVPTSLEAKEWEGWGSALKPSYEPIIMARKPFKGPLYKNVLKHRTGALNIDGTRIPTEEKLTRKLGKSTESDSGWKSTNRSEVAGKDGGRWPANIVHDGSAEVTSLMPSTDKGSAARFFYAAKPSKREKNLGLEGKNTHPTVKGIELMRWLVRLVTPPGVMVLDPFCGSGSTGVACLYEGFDFVGIEADAEYADLSVERIRSAESSTAKG
jgi:site-specific DNA-methyltransferase (adenine-specific)